MPLTVTHPGAWSFVTEQDSEEVRSLSTVDYLPDPSWAHIDARGHLHSWGLHEDPETGPSWEPEYEDPYWCDLCREVHEHDVRREVCAVPGCGETVTPAYVQRYHGGRHRIPTTRRAFVVSPDGERFDLWPEDLRTLEEVGMVWLPEVVRARYPWVDLPEA